MPSPRLAPWLVTSRPISKNIFAWLDWPQIVVYPELSLTGYELALADSLAFAIDDARLSSLLDLAASEGTILVVGVPARIGSSLYVGAFILYPNCTTDLYTKHYLGAFPASAICDSCNGTVPSPEASVIQPGDRNPLTRLGDNIAAVAICADIGRPAHPQRAAERKADAYLASMFVIPSDFDGEVSKLKGYAKKYRMLTALANFGCPSGGLRSAGRSSIWSEEGELLVQLEETGSGIAVVMEGENGYRSRAVITQA